MSSKWIYFWLDEQAGKTRKTNIWKVMAKHGDTILGEIKWYSGWRKYAFFPETGTLFEPVCLNDISSMCRESTKTHWKNAHLTKAKG